MLNLTGTFGVHQGIASLRKSKDGGLRARSSRSAPASRSHTSTSSTATSDFIAEYVQVNNKSGGLCDFGSNGVGAASTAGGGDPKGIATGLRYTF